MPKGVADVVEVFSGLVEAAGVLVDWVKAQEGLKYNLYTFAIDNSKQGNPQKPNNPSAAGAQPGRSKNSASVAAIDPMTIRDNGMQFLWLKVKSSDESTAESVYQGESFTSFASFSIILIPMGSSTVGFVSLHERMGFDTAAGSQAEVDFNGQEVDGGYLITFKGFVNRIGPGFGHFSGSVLLEYPKLTVKVIYSKIVPDEAGKIYGGQFDHLVEFLF